MSRYATLFQDETLRANQRLVSREGTEGREPFAGLPYLIAGSSWARLPKTPLVDRLHQLHRAGAGPFLAFLSRRYGAATTVKDALARLRAELIGPDPAPEHEPGANQAAEVPEPADDQPESSERVHQIDTDLVDGSTQTGDQTHGGDSQSGEVPDGESGAGGEHDLRSGGEPDDRASEPGEETADADDDPATDIDQAEQGGESRQIDRALRRVRRQAEKAGRNRGHGGVTAKLDAPRRVLVPKVAQALAALVGAGATDDGPRWDHQRLAERLLTHRPLQRARKEEVARPLIAVLPDVSGSCGHISGESCALAMAASELGVPGADVLVVAHSNGQPEQAMRNGRAVALTEGEVGAPASVWDGTRWAIGPQRLDAVCERLLGPELEAVIAVGDNDAIEAYHALAERPGVTRLVWIDHYLCGAGEVKVRRCKYDLSGWSPAARGKVTWVMGCKTAEDMLRALRLAIGA